MILRALFFVTILILMFMKYLSYKIKMKTNGVKEFSETNIYWSLYRETIFPPPPCSQDKSAGVK